MCTQAQLHRITSQMVQCYRDIYDTNVVGVFLYGSYARGDYDNESDIDMTAIVKGSRIRITKQAKSCMGCISGHGAEK